jgi:hypothetical protein
MRSPQGERFRSQALCVLDAALRRCTQRVQLRVRGLKHAAFSSQCGAVLLQLSALSLHEALLLLQGSQRGVHSRALGGQTMALLLRLRTSSITLLSKLVRGHRQLLALLSRSV